MLPFNLISSSLPDLMKHAKRLITEGFLPLDDQWQFTQSKSSPHPPPQYLIFLVHPNNLHLKEHVYTNQLLGSSSTNNSSTTANSDSNNWFEKEMEEIAKSKEDVHEYFSYLKGFEFRVMTKLNDPSLFERWNQYPEHYILYLKVWNGTKYEPANLLAMAIKSLKINEKQHKIGYTGSGWVSKKYRSNVQVKSSLWLLHFMVFKLLNVNYGYGQVVFGNVKSLGSIQKTGMTPTRYSVNRVCLPFSVEKKKIENGLEFCKIQNFESYQKLMNERFRNGLLFANLREFYDSPFFLGCFENSELDFQIWKARKSEIVKTKELLQTYMIFNISEFETNTPESYRNLINQLVHSIIPSITEKKPSAEEDSLPGGESDNKVLLIFYFINESRMRNWLLETYQLNESIAIAGLTIVLEHVSNLFDIGNESGVGTSTKYKQEDEEIAYLFNNQENLRHFFDPRDDASSVFVWNDGLSEKQSKL